MVVPVKICPRHSPVTLQNLVALSYHMGVMLKKFGGAVGVPTTYDGAVADP